MNYYISDLHFFHQNILRFDQRPFATVEEMKNALISNWNSTVTNEDIVYILHTYLMESLVQEQLSLLFV